MAKRNWKREQPRSLKHAMELCVDHAKSVKNLSVERIADLIGITSQYTLYKWLDEARMPALMIRPFEHACGVSFVTQYLAASDYQLLVPMPKAKAAKDTDLMALQQSFSQAVTVLAAFYMGNESGESASAELARHMAEVASHRVRVERMGSPELELFGGDE
ncbi:MULTISPECIES: hypothetical protein [unclassified Oceanobacter]|uniref:hypothetical protein n=1 Tax=unclassified Oceanobacter TaxID=2620260 RepID=UPI0027349A83|nr:MULTISPECIES: hypothetical protein [unclassified Oceanobacter]MDP2607981.1 hypothetical protein [Oceanobacter sp. 1_MG-2023]MDP2611357.1 hypothetical protein [Oceanobacter sp. 2_MG-2023]